MAVLLFGNKNGFGRVGLITGKNQQAGLGDKMYFWQA